MENPETENKRGSVERLFGPDDPYVAFLRKRKDRSFYLKPWNGNSGDVLIWMGTESLLTDLGIVRTLDPRKADVILIPGGNQTMWHPNVAIWKEVWSRWPDKEFVVGPTTVQLGYTHWRKALQESTANVTGFFARDPQSYATLRECRLSDRIETGLSHDPALYLWDSDLIRAHREAATKDYVLAAFRQDHEASMNRKSRMLRLSGLLPHFIWRRIRSRWTETHQQGRFAIVTRRAGKTDPLKVCDASLWVFECFLEIVRSASEVHTDRLHCMLLAVMLGKPTFAYPTAYGKLESVYAHSLKGRAHVEFVEDAQPFFKTGRERPASNVFLA
ncbi:MAG TPA: polysaccharide pyruvyl transferase family protein [Sedimentisphaerales bacterium]|nr:polysaccharide pyruvyl transferase family protein [Sedimentisphaerales bacterium]